MSEGIGLHTLLGSRFFDSYIFFKQDELEDDDDSDEDSDDMDSENELEQAKKAKIVKRIRELYHKQIGTPLFGNNEVLEKYEEFEKTYAGGEQEAIANITTAANLYRSSFTTLQELKPYEQEIADIIDGGGDKGERRGYLAEKWKAYIDHEQKAGNRTRQKFLYERALEYCYWDESLWTAYGTFVTYTLKDKERSLDIYRRAVRGCPGSATLWVELLRALERCGADTNREYEEELVSAHKDTMILMFGTCEEYLELGISFIDFRRRQLEYHVDNESARGTDLLDEVIAAFTETTKMLETYFPDNIMAMYRVQRYLADFYLTLGQADSALEVWNEILKTDMGKMSSTWSEAVACFKSADCGPEAMKLSFRASNTWVDYPMSNIELWENTIRSVGSLADFDEIAVKLANKKAQVYEKVATMTEKQEQQAQKREARQQKKQKQKELQKKKQQEKKKHTEKDSKKRPIEASGTSDESGIAVKKTKLDEEVTETVKTTETDMDITTEASKEEKTDEEIPETKKEEENHDSKMTAFVVNLRFDVKENDVKAFFTEKCGTVKSVNLAIDHKAKDPKKSCRGYGYVDFESEESITKAMELNGVEFQGRKLNIRHYNADKTKQKIIANKQARKEEEKLASTTIFVTNLPQSVTDELLTVTFEEFGKVKDCEVFRFRGKPKGHALVEFEVQESCQKALSAKAPITVDGKEVQVKESKRIVNKQQQEQHTQESRRHSMLFVPSSMKKITTSTSQVHVTATGGDRKAKSNAQFRAMLGF
eukprot:TRINITY_DN7163_c0_g4_i1.p1 TRINITY_DN7163_c0_g4~~TRINITY_DN7163_c0_g4_i1.p1  ORF type:complete len:887 (+),score=289.28 TRINITY_DN7163_c0_g4_i1:363-2663(+)